MPDSVFVAREDGVFLATELARGPWDPGAQHGGAPAALLMRAFEQLPMPDDLVVARVTYEFMRPVPIGELRVRAEVVRPGQRVQLLEGSISRADGTEVVRGRALQVRRADGLGPQAAPPAVPTDPSHGRENGLRPPYRPMFAPDAIEIRFVPRDSRQRPASGNAPAGGGAPVTAWFRLRAPLVAGETASALQGLAAASDFGNGISAILPWSEYVFINPDLTLYLDRLPTGDWFCLEARTTIAPDGIGTAEAVAYDLRGRVGRATQALLVAPR